MWVDDITYVRLQAEFVYLAVVLDGFSRRVVGWELGRNLQAALPLAALGKAAAAGGISASFRSRFTVRQQ